MADTRERMITSTALLVRERGARATSIDDVLAHSGAPRGSVYHHFPGGRDQLLREATDYAAGFVAAGIEGASGSVELLDALIGSYREQLLATDFRAGCPVVAVAVEADSGLRGPAASAFAHWSELIAAKCAGDGIESSRAEELASFVIAAFEGAIVLARARRDAEPLDVVHRRLREALLAEIPGGSA